MRVRHSLPTRGNPIGQDLSDFARYRALILLGRMLDRGMQRRLNANAQRFGFRLSIYGEPVV